MKNQNEVVFPIKFQAQARYKLKIQCILENDWGERLGGMEIIDVNDEDGITSLEGVMRDQAEL